MTRPLPRFPARASRAPEGRGATARRCGAALLLALVAIIASGGAVAAPGAAGTPAASAPEAAQPSLQLDLDVYLVTLEERDGEATWIRSLALEVVPGALLEWWLRARNDVGEALGPVALDLPIPTETAYLPGSAWLARLTGDDDVVPADEVAYELEFSADDAATFAPEPLVRMVTRDDGEAVEEIVPVDDYTHVRARIEGVPADATLVLVVRTSVR